jgi:stage II sporulation protein P
MQEESPVQEEESAQEQAGNDYISLEKLNDFDYLIQNFYTVDKSTTINSSQLNAQSLLEKNCTIQKTQGEEPQILIYHTHSQEGYSDSVEGDLSTTVMAVGDRLTQILQETYGYQVLHHTGTYDVEDRNHAYSLAAPDLEQILRDHPSIEVVIDLHRDGVGDDTRLVTEMNGTQMAQIMFFNGLSRSTATGDIDYLPNPYIEDNLAFSLQMQLAASEMYPGFARKIYLKSYRYNMHYCPKSLLIEVGAQTNTLQEALNAMEPLAAVLDAVLGGST